jgi:hypothetical protein
MSTAHLESFARALEDVARELYPEYDWCIEVREREVSEISDTTDRPHEEEERNGVQ